VPACPPLPAAASAPPDPPVTTGSVELSLEQPPIITSDPTVIASTLVNQIELRMSTSLKKLPGLSLKPRASGHEKPPWKLTSSHVPPSFQGPLGPSV
jgi:hypothetical protein